MELSALHRACAFSLHDLRFLAANHFKSLPDICKGNVGLVIIGRFKAGWVIYVTLCHIRLRGDENFVPTGINVSYT